MTLYYLSALLNFTTELKDTILFAHFRVHGNNLSWIFYIINALLKFFLYVNFIKYQYNNIHVSVFIYLFIYIVSTSV